MCSKNNFVLSIVAQDIGKRYGRNWVFRHLNFELEKGSKTAISGKNGSGKSTLLQIISGYLSPSKGSIHFTPKPPEETDITLIGPYTELIEEFTLKEFLAFHAKFRQPGIDFHEMADRASLPMNKRIADYSTGMKQRTKLITAFFFENDLILLDEPTANLDEEGFDWWKTEISIKSTETIIIATNQSNEKDICPNAIDL